jgi:hypothetical protein
MLAQRRGSSTSRAWVAKEGYVRHLGKYELSRYKSLTPENLRKMRPRVRQLDKHVSLPMLMTP